jgi:hypothetical protein
MRVQERIPRQWFFDVENPGWVRNGSLVLDEMSRVCVEMKKCWFPWSFRYRALERAFERLDAEYLMIKFGYLRSDRLVAEDVQVESNLNSKLYPENPYLWSKKKE